MYEYVVWAFSNIGYCNLEFFNSKWRPVGLVEPYPIWWLYWQMATSLILAQSIPPAFCSSALGCPYSTIRPTVINGEVSRPGSAGTWLWTSESRQISYLVLKGNVYETEGCTQGTSCYCVAWMKWGIWSVAVVSRMEKTSIQCMPKACAKRATEKKSRNFSPGDNITCFYKTCLFGKMCMLVNWNIHCCNCELTGGTPKQTSSSKLSEGTFLEPCLVCRFDSSFFQTTMWKF